MKTYIGTKIVNAKPMNRLDYNVFRGWLLPEDEDGSDEGYLVEYVDGGKANTNRYKGYVSWSPKDVFERAYKEKEFDKLFSSETFDIGEAIKHLKDGKKVARQGWNGKGMFIVYMSGLKLPPFNTQGTHRKVNDRTAKWIGEDKPLDSQPYLAMYTANKQWQPGWLASQNDLLAEDWQVV